MTICCVVGCKNKFSKNQKDIRFHRFPKDDNTCSKWKTITGKVVISSATRICSVHFEKECYNPSGLLKFSSIPTLLLPKQETIEQETIEDEIIIEDNNRTSKHCQTENDLNCVWWLEKEELKKELQQLQRKNKLYERLLQNVERQHKQLKQSLKEIFTPTQLQKLENKSKCQKWTANDISSAVSMYNAGPRLYKMLYRNNFPLPAPRTLRYWRAKVPLKPEPEVLRKTNKSE